MRSASKNTTRSISSSGGSTSAIISSGHLSDEVRRDFHGRTTPPDDPRSSALSYRGLHGDDLLVEASESTLVLADDQRLVAALRDPASPNIDLPIVGEDCVAAGAVTLVVWPISLAIACSQVLGPLRAHRALDDDLLQGRVDRLISPWVIPPAGDQRSWDLRLSALRSRWDIRQVRPAQPRRHCNRQ